MQVFDIFRFRNAEIRTLHLTWIAVFICFYVWFNMAPLATVSLPLERYGEGIDLLDQRKALKICYRPWE